MMWATVRGEWIKVWTLRSTGWALAPVVLGAAGLAALVSLSFRAAAAGDVDAVFAVFYGFTIVQLPLVVFGIVLMAGEYASGTVQVSLLATPHRGRFYLAKVLVGGLLAAGTALLAVVAAAAAGQAVLGPYRPQWTDPGVVRALVGGWLYLTLICLFAVGVAAMVRRPVVALAGLVPLLFLGSQGLGNIPGVRVVAQFLPDQAGLMILHLAGPPDDPVFDRAYGPWGGLGILALWTVAALAGGYLLLRRRDV